MKAGQLAGGVGNMQLCIRFHAATHMVAALPEAGWWAATAVRAWLVGWVTHPAMLRGKLSALTSPTCRHRRPQGQARLRWGL